MHHRLLVSTYSCPLVPTRGAGPLRTPKPAGAQGLCMKPCCICTGPPRVCICAVDPLQAGAVPGTGWVLGAATCIVQGARTSVCRADAVSSLNVLDPWLVESWMQTPGMQAACAVCVRCACHGFKSVESVLHTLLKNPLFILLCPAYLFIPNTGRSHTLF